MAALCDPQGPAGNAPQAPLPETRGAGTLSVRVAGSALSPGAHHGGRRALRAPRLPALAARPWTLPRPPALSRGPTQPEPGIKHQQRGPITGLVHSCSTFLCEHQRDYSSAGEKAMESTGELLESCLIVRTDIDTLLHA